MYKFLLSFFSTSFVSFKLMDFEKNYKKNIKPKEHIILLGDGFLSRGFIDTIDKRRFKITQIYKDKFINPQDLIYQLNKNKWNPNSLHMRDLVRANADNKIQVEINDMRYFNNTFIMNEKEATPPTKIKYDHLVIGLGSQKTLKDWENTIKTLIFDTNNKNIGIIGMGPSGIELATILSKNNNITLIDSLNKENTLNYVSKDYKNILLNILYNKNIHTIYNEFYDPIIHKFDTTIMCVGNRVNKLVSCVKIDDRFRDCRYNNVYLGGDCANINLPKTAQLAYAQGIYIAKQINGSELRPFRYIDNSLENNIDRNFYNYNSNGISLNIGDNTNLICGHQYLPNGKYPSEIIKFYSMFIV